MERQVVRPQLRPGLARRMLVLPQLGPVFTISSALVELVVVVMCLAGSLGPWGEAPEEKVVAAGGG